MGSLRLGLAQINTTVGNLEGNLRLISDWIERAKSESVDVVIFPELTITGYPPEDLLLNPKFIDDNLEALQRVASMSQDISVVVGFADRKDSKIFNAAAIFSNEQLIGTYHKNLLPNYAVFDEKRYFDPGSDYPIFIADGMRIGITICEDIWDAQPPIRALAVDGKADLILNLSASPFHMGKVYDREAMMSGWAEEFGVYIGFCNLVGGQDELIFSGRSAVFAPDGQVIARAKAFDEDLLTVDLEIDERAADVTYPLETELPLSVSSVPKSPMALRVEKPHSPTEAIYRALVLGTRDYVRKNQMESVLIGISGGIDSALVAAIAVDALGPKNVLGVYMPSKFSSDESEAGAKKLAENLVFELKEIPIESVLNSTLTTLNPHFTGLESGVTEENLQSRIRGMLLMAFSNKFGFLVLSTGNKSEYAVGYSTLYGDMVGGLAVIKDLSKTRVYELARWRNIESEVIPQNIINRAPSAELREDQRDEDDLPLSYEKLDRVLESYVERDVINLRR